MKADIRVKEGNLLKEYYANYLREVRGLKESSVRHYYDALNNISRRLKAMNMVNDDVYEIRDLDYLQQVRDTLFADKDFIDMNERGKRMYSAGLNNYIRFAEGKGFATIAGKAEIFDIPSLPEEPMVTKTKVWRRSTILRNQVIAMADYSCEIDGSHTSFIAEKTNRPYMEGHHAIPMNLQKSFTNSLDVYANIVCLCPLCHRKIHHGILSEREKMCHQIYDQREQRLQKSGLDISRKEFTSMIVNYGE